MMTMIMDHGDDDDNGDDGDDGDDDDDDDDDDDGDFIRAKIIRTASRYIDNVVATLFNTTFRCGRFPSTWKRAKSSIANNIAC